MIIIKQVHEEYIQDIIDIYDSANLLFDTGDCAPGTYEIFEKVFKNDEVFVLFENDTLAAFASCHLHNNFIEITGMYVKADHQHKGYGRILLGHIEDKKFMGMDVFLLSVLKNAPWAIEFYKSCGYSKLSEDKAIECNYEGISFDEWSQVMYKKIDQQKNTCRCHPS